MTMNSSPAGTSLLASIASVVIKGNRHRYGRRRDHFGFVTERIGRIQSRRQQAHPHLRPRKRQLTDRSDE
jgi:hypothetical protein